MSVSIDDEEAKDRLLDGISQSVKELQREHCQGEDSPAVTNDNVHLQRLCQAIDQVFLCGLVKREQGYWKLVQRLTRSEAIHLLEHLPHVKTNLGRGRAWLYLSLNENVLESYLRSLMTCSKLIDSMYSKGSFLRDDERLFTLQTLVTGMDFLKFELTVDCEHFDRFGLLPVATNCDLRRDLSFDYTSSSVEASRTFRLRHSPMKAPDEESSMPTSWIGLKDYISSKAARLRSAPGQGGSSWSEEASEVLSTSWRNLKSRVWASGGGSGDVATVVSSSASTGATSTSKSANGDIDDDFERKGDDVVARPTFRQFSHGEPSDPSKLWRQYSDGSPAAQSITTQSTLLPEDGLPLPPSSDTLCTPTRPVSVGYESKTQAEPSSGTSTTLSSSVPVTWSSVRNSTPPADPCVRPKSPVATATNTPSFKTRGRRLTYSSGGEDVKSTNDPESSLEPLSGGGVSKHSPDTLVAQGDKKSKKKKKKKVKATMAMIASPASVGDYDDIEPEEHSSPESSLNIAEKMERLNQQLLAQQSALEAAAASEASSEVFQVEATPPTVEEQPKPFMVVEEVADPLVESLASRNSPAVGSGDAADVTDGPCENKGKQGGSRRQSPVGSSGSSSPAGAQEPAPTASLSIYDQFVGDDDIEEEEQGETVEDAMHGSQPFVADDLSTTSSKTSLSAHSTGSGRASTGPVDSSQDVRPSSRSSLGQPRSAQSSPWHAANEDERGAFGSQPVSSFHQKAAPSQTPTVQADMHRPPISVHANTVGQVSGSPTVAMGHRTSPKASVVEVVEWGEGVTTSSGKSSPLQAESNPDDSQETGEGAMPERPNLSEADPTINDVHVDHNLQLMFSLQIFKSSSNENLIKMVRVESSMGRGKVKTGFALLTNYAFYLVHNDGQDGKYATEICYPYRVWDHLEISLNWQTVTIVCKNVASSKTLIMGNEPVCRHLVKMMIRAAQSAGVPAPRIDASDSDRLHTLEHCIEGFDAMSDATDSFRVDDFRVLRYSLVHWERLNSKESHTLFVINRAVIKEGPIHFKVSKFGMSYWNEAYAILKDGTFFLYNQKDDSAPKHMIQLWGTHCGGCRRLNVSDRPNCFEVKSSEESLTLSADSPEDVALWQQAICEVVAGTISSQPAQCIQCSLVVTANKLYAYLEDFWGGPLQLLSACDISEVTTVFVDDSVRTYCTVAFGLTFESGSWLLCFESEYELGMFEEALASAWRDLFQIPLSFTQIGQGPARERARDAVSLVQGRFHRSDSITRGRS